VKREWSVDPSEFANVSYTDTVERDEAVIDAVESLPEDLRAVINAMFWEGLSAPAAIRSLGISAATFYRRLAEAKRLLALGLDGSAGPVRD
jgi:DNA-directed RNA polymerase specialized sigma24 family protein